MGLVSGPRAPRKHRAAALVPRLHPADAVDLRCARCGRRELTPVKRRGVLDCVVMAVFYRPFVCAGCRQRVRLFVTPLERAGLPRPVADVQQR